ncbi:hypothetical protein GCM10008012_16560 [Rhizobium anhuiense]|nr:hypothetical protein GCM10008012_16560 [Rhizobium anhuiense]
MRDLIDLFAQAGIDKVALSIKGGSIALGSRPQCRQHDQSDRSKPADGNQKQNSPRSNPGLLKRVGAGRKNDVQAWTPEHHDTGALAEANKEAFT